MRSIMTTDSSLSQKTPQVFTDEELSEIFQINFAEIFGQSPPYPNEKTEPKNISKKPISKGQICCVLMMLLYPILTMFAIVDIHTIATRVGNNQV